MNVRDIAKAIEATVSGDPELVVTGVDSLEDAGPDRVCLYLGGKYKKLLAETRARVLVVAPGTKLEGFTLIETVRPRLRFIEVIRLFHPDKRRPPGVHPTACVAGSARLGKDLFIGAKAVVGEGSVIGDACEIHEGVVIYDDVVVGRDCRLFASVVLREGTRLGDRVIIHSGAVIGADGFGYEAGPDGVYAKIPQVGRVVIGDDVEIGANTCVDRAALGETSIGAGTKIDNLCQLGHGVKVGRHSIISGLEAIGGSARIGDHVVIGGGGVVADHSDIGDRVMVAGGSGVHGHVPPGSVLAGVPAVDLRAWRRSVAAFNLLGKRRGADRDEDKA